MSSEVVETLVEPLVLGDERTSSRGLLVAVEKGDHVAALMKDKQPADIARMVDDDEDDAEDDGSKKTIEAAEEVVLLQQGVSPREANLRVDSQNPLVVGPVHQQAAVIASSRTEENVDNPPISMVEKLVSPEMKVESARQPSNESEHAKTVEPTATPAMLQDFLYKKIVENQCNTHAKEIHEYLSSHFSEGQLTSIVPQVISNLSQLFQQEAQGQEVSVDIQTSLCLVEQMVLPAGRQSPLQDMYTAEEEEMLNQLVHAGTSNNSN